MAAFARAVDRPPSASCPDRLVLGSSNSPMCALAPQNAGYRRAWKGCCLIPMLAMHPCVHSGTLLCRTGLRAPSKIFRVFCVKSGFPGAARLSRAPKNVWCSAKARILGASGVGWCRRSWSGLAVAGVLRSKRAFFSDVERSTVLHNHLL